MAGDEVITPACWAAQRSSASDRFQVCPPKKNRAGINKCWKFAQKKGWRKSEKMVESFTEKGGEEVKNEHHP
jgi:hypothetical protein